MKRLYWRLFVIWHALKWCWRVNLGDRVVYKGRRYIVHNGVCPESWRIGIDNDQDGWVPRSECRKVWSLRNLIGSFKTGHRFYMGYWYDIWVREGVTPWMRGCRIW